VDELSGEGLAARAGVDPGDVDRLAALGLLSRPEPPFRPGDVTRVSLLRTLERSGIASEDVGRAVAAGEFSLEFAEGLFPPGRSPALSDSTLAELTAQHGLPMDRVQDLYTALGLPPPQPDDRLRMDDAATAPLLVALFGFGFTPAQLLHASRFWGENLHRLARAQTRFFDTYVMRPMLRSGLSEQEMLNVALPMAAQIQQIDEQLLAWLHHRHLETALLDEVLTHVETALARAGVAAPPSRADPAIAFVDLSGFTALTEELGDEAAAELTGRMADLVHRAARRHGGSTVKFLGDGAMLHFLEPSGAVLALLELVDALPVEGLPPAHAAVSCGPVIARDGDYFGATVNLAARLLGVAGPGDVIVTSPAATRAAGDGLRFEELEPVSLKGIPEPVPAFRAARA
jgi:adenylate cyclase